MLRLRSSKRSAKRSERRAFLEDEVGAVLDLAAEQPVGEVRQAVRVIAGVERHQFAQPALERHLEIRRGEAVGQLLQAVGVGALDEGVGGLAEEDAFVPETTREPFVLVEAEANVEWEV